MIGRVILIFTLTFFAANSFAQTIDLKDVEGDIIESDIGSGATDIQYCISPGGDEDLNYLTIQLDVSVSVSSYDIDWGDGTIDNVTGYSSNIITHTYTSTNTALDPFYELEIININGSALSISRNFQIDRTSIIIPSNTQELYCGEDGVNTSVTIAFYTDNLSRNIDWEIDWGDGQTQALLFDDLNTSEEFPEISHDYTYTSGVYEYIIQMTPGNSLNPACVTGFLIPPIIVTFQEEITPEISTQDNVTEICESGAFVTFQRTTSNPLNNVADTDELKWSIRNGASTLIEIPYGPLGTAPSPTPGGTSYSGTNTEFTYEFLAADIASGDLITVTLTEKNACSEPFIEYTINVESLPVFNNVTVTPDAITCTASSVDIDWDTESNTTYEYLILDQSAPDPDPVSINNTVTPPFTFSDNTGDYTYWIKATNTAGCIEVTSVDIDVLTDVSPELDITPLVECDEATFTVGTNSTDVPAGATFFYEYSTVANFTSNVNLIGSTTSDSETFETTLSNNDANPTTNYFVRLRVVTLQGCEFVDEQLTNVIQTKYQPRSDPDLKIIAKQVNGTNIPFADQETFEFCEGDLVTFEVQGGSTFGSSYTWTVVGSPPNTPSPNTEFQITTNNSFDLQVSESLNSCTTITPPEVNVTVIPIPVINDVTASSNLTFCDDGINAVSLTATGTDVGTFEWFKFNSISGLYENTGITGSVLTLNSVSESGTYKVRGIQSGALATCEGSLYPVGSGFTIEIQPIPGEPTISASGPLIFCESLTNSVQLTANQNGSVVLDRVEWYRVGSPDELIETDVNTGGNAVFNSTLSADRLNENEESGSYYAIAYGTGSDNCSVQSAITEITIKESPDRPGIIPLTNTNICEGSGNVQLQADIVSTSYRWFRENGATDTELTETSNTLTLATNAETGDYYVIAVGLDDCESSPSTPISVSINPNPNTPSTPVETNGRVNKCENVSTTIILQTTYQGAGIEYRWYKNTEDNAGTATAFSVSFNNPPTVDITSELVLGDNYFFVQAENQSTGCTSSISSSFYFELFAEPAQPTISNAGSNDVCEPSTITLTVDEINTNETYEWYVNGSFITNTSDPELQYNTLGENQDITVVRVSNEGCKSIASNSETLNIYALAGDKTIDISDSDNLICANSSSTIVVEDSDSDFNYVLKESGSTITTVPGNGSDIDLPTGALTAGSYSYSVEAVRKTGLSCPRVLTTGLNLSVASPPTLDNFSTSTPEVCIGTSATMEITISGGTPPFTISYNTDQDATTKIESTNDNTFSFNSSNLTATSQFQLLSFTDGAGCNIDVSGAPSPTVIVDNPTSVTLVPNGPICYEENGQVQFDFLGGIGDYTVQFQVNGGTPISANGPNPIIYGDDPGENALQSLQSNAVITLVSATTSNGCNISPVSSTTTIVVNDPLFDLSSNAIELCSYENLNLELNISGGVGPYQVVIDNNQSLPQINLSSYNNGTSIPVSGIPNATTVINFSVTSVIDNGTGCEVRVNSTQDINVQVNVQPDVSTITSSNPSGICVGTGTVTLSPDTQVAGYSYEWVDASNNQQIQLSASPNLVLSDVQNRSYKVRLISPSDCIGEFSDPETVIIYDLPPQPQITDISGTPLADQVICDDVTLTLYSTTNQADQYKWYREGNIEVGTGQTFTPTISGNYSVETISVNACISTKSDPINITINPTPGKPDISVLTPGSGVPEICDDPADANVIVLGSNNPGNLADSYEWYKTSAPGVIVATTQTLTLNQESEEGSYQVRIKTADDCFSVLSDAVAVAIKPLPSKPTVIVDDTDNSICADGTQIKLTAFPDPIAVKYLWYLDGTGLIQESASNELILDNNNVSGNYYVIAEADAPTSCQSEESDLVSISINPIPGTPQIILSSVSDEICADGAAVVLEIESPLPSNSDDFNWYKTSDPGTVIGTGNSISLNSVAQSGDYIVRAVGISPTLCEGSASSSYSVTINPVPQAPTISFSSTSGTLDICDDNGTSSVTLTANSPDGNSVTFDWFLDGNLFQSNTSEITLNDISQTGNYTVVGYGVLNTECPSSPSSATLVNIYEIPPAPLLSGTTSLCAGADNELYVIDNDVPGASFSWSVPAGVTVEIGGGTGQSFVIVDFPTAGDYDITVTQTQNGCESTTGLVSVTVLDPTVTAGINGPDQICENQTDVEFSIDSPTPGSTYAWTVPNGASFSVESVSKISVDFGTAAQAGASPVIEVIETNLAGCESIAVSKSISITELPTATLSGDATVCLGKSTDLLIDITGMGPWEVRYAANAGGPAVVNTINIPDQAAPFTYNLTVSPTVTTNYSLVSITDGSLNCEGISISGNAFVEVLPEPTLDAGVDQSIAQGSFAALNPTVSGTYTDVEWTSDRPGDGSFNNSGLLSPVFTPDPAQTGDFVLTIKLTDTNGFCDEIEDFLLVTVNPAGTVDAGPDQTICDNGSIAVLAATDPSSAGYTDILWESDRPGDGSFSNALSNTTQFQPNPGATGDFILTAKYTDNDGSDGFLPDTDDFLTLTVNPLPEIGFNSVSDIIVCEGSGSVDLDLNLSGTGPWTVFYTYNGGSEQSFNVAAGNNSFTFTVPASAIGDNIYTLTNITENDGALCDGDVTSGFETVNIIRRALPAVTITSSDISLCDDGSLATISVELTGTGPWDLTYFDGSNTTVINGINTSSYSFDVAGVPGNTTTYTITQLVESNGAVCNNSISGESVDVTKNLRPTGVISIPAPDATICEGSSTNLTVILTGIGPWVIDYTDGTSDFTFTSSDQNPTQLIAVSPAVGGTNYTLKEIRDLTTTCVSTAPDLSGNALITVKEGIQVDDLADRTILQGSTTTFSANATGDYTKVEWTSNRPGIFSTPGALSSDFSPSETGIYNITFTATDESGICAPPVSKSLILNIVESADAIVDAGTDGESCQAQPILLAATVGSSYTDEPGDLISWSHNGLGSIDPDPSDPGNPAKAQYTPSASETGSVTFTVSVSDNSGVAPDNQDEVAYTIFQTPNATIVSNDEIICDDGVSEATIVISLEGKGPWSLTYTDGSNDFTIPVNTATYNLNVSGTPGTTTAYSLKSVVSTSLSNCENTGLSSTVNITNRELPTAEFDNTTPITLCDDGSIAVLPVNLTGTGPWSLVWIDDFNNVENTTTINSLPFSLTVNGVAGETVQYSILRVTENNGVSCTNNDLSSLGLDLEVFVTKNERPTAAIIGNPVICEIDGSESATLGAAISGVGPFEVTYSVNSVETTISIAETNPNADPANPFNVSFDVVPGGVGTFNYTLTNIIDLGVTPNCESLAGDLSGVSQVTVKPKIEVDPLNDQSILQGGSLNLSGTATGSFTMVEWTIDPDEGVFTAPNSLNTTFQPLPDQVGTFTITLTATDESGVCASSATSVFELTINPSDDATLNAGLDETVCEGETIFLDAEVGIAYTNEPGDIITWSTPNGTGTLTQDSGDPTLATYIPDGNESSSVQFIVSVEDFSSIAENKSDIVIYSIRPLPGAEFLTSDVSICEDGSSEITVRFTGTGPWDFKYEKNGVEVVETGIAATTFNITANGIDGTTTYAITEVSTPFTSNGNDKNCIVPVSGEEITITSLPLPVVSIIDDSPQTICDDGSTAVINLQITNGIAPWLITYEENGIEQTLSIPTANYDWNVPGISGQSTIYKITNIVDASAQSCEQDLSSAGLEVQIDKNKRPTAVLSGDQIICEVDGNEVVTLQLELTGTGPFDLTYIIDSNPVTIEISETNPNANPDDSFIATFDVIPGNTGTFSNSLGALVDKGVTPNCSSQAGDISGTALITVKPKIEVQVLSDRTILQGSTLDLNGVVNGSFTQVNWSIDPDEGVFFPSDNVNTTFTPTASQVGAFTITLTASDSPSDICSVDQQSFTLTINPTDDAIVDAGEPQTVCENENISLNATIGSAYTDVVWDHNGTGSIVQDTGDPSIATYFPASGETGIIQFTVSATDANGIAPDKSDNVIITINALPGGEIISGNEIICDDGSVSTITVSLTGTGPWDIEYSDGIDNFILNDITTPTYSFDVAGRVSEDVIYSLIKVTEKDGPSCEFIISGESVTITKRALPTAAITSVDVNELCDDGSLATITVELSGTGPWNLVWKEDISNIENLVPNITTSPYELKVPGIVANTATYSLVSITENNGATCSQSITGQETVITKYARPTGVISGDQTICEGGDATLNLELTGTGPWEIKYMEGSVERTHSSTTASDVITVNPEVGSTPYSLVSVKDLGTNCESVSGDLSGSALVVVKQSIDVLPLTDRSLLQGNTLSLSGEANGAFTEVLWSIDPDVGSFLPDNSLNTTFTPAPDQVGVFTIRLQAFDNPDDICSFDEEILTLTINPSDDAIVEAGSPQITCENDIISLDATIGVAYTDITWQTNGTGTLVQDSGDPSLATYEPANGETGTLQFTVFATDANGIAPDKSDNVLITINPLPTVEMVSPDIIICDDGTTATLSISLTGTGPWDVTYTDGTDNFLLEDITNPSFNLQVPGTVGSLTYRITEAVEKNGAVCTGIIGFDDEMIVTTREMPTAVISSVDNPTLCDDGSEAIISISMTGVGPWDITWKDDVTGTNNLIADITESPYLLSVPGLAGSTVTYSLVRVVEKNGANCIVDITDQNTAILKYNRPTGILSGSTTICENGSTDLTFDLTGTGPWDVIYTDGNEAFTFSTSTASTSVSVMPGVGATTYSIVNIDDNGTGCTSIAGDLSGTPLITVKPKVQVTSLTDRTMLQGFSIDFVGEASGSYTLVEWEIDGPGTFSSPNSLNTSFTPLPDQTGDYMVTFRAIDDPSNICSSDETTFTLTINPAGDAIVFAGEDQIVCEGETILLEAVIGSAYTDVAWSNVSGTGTLVQDLVEPEKAVYTPGTDETGIIQFTVLATDVNGIAPDKSDNVVVTINPTPTARIISGDRIICDDGSKAIITVSLTGVGPWDLEYSDGLSTTLIEDITTPTYNIEVEGQAGSSLDYTITSVTEFNGTSCSGAILGESVTITRNELPTAHISSDHVVLCDDGSSAEIVVELTGNGPWDLLWSDGGANNFISGITSSPYSFFVNGVAGETITYSITGVFENDGTSCFNSISDQSVDVSRNSRPTAVLSGDNTLCEGEGTLLSFDMTGTGPWEITFSNGIDNTTFTTSIASFEQTFEVFPMVGATNYSLVSVLDLGTGCSSQTGDLTGTALINVKPGITVDVGGDKTILENQSVLITATASGGFNEIEWSSTGNGIFSPTNSLNSTYAPQADETGTFTIRLTVRDSDDVCAEGFDELELKVLPENAVSVFAGTEFSICEGVAIPLNGSLGEAYESASWSGGLGDFENPDLVSTIYNPAPGELGLITFSLTATDADGIFPDKTDQITIEILPTPTIQAGDAQTVCQGSAVQLNALLTGNNTNIQWTTNGEGSFSNEGGLTTFYLPEENETGDITMTITAIDPLSLCNTVMDEVIISYKPAVTVTVSDEITICQGESIPLFPVITGTDLEYSWSSSGNGTFDNPIAKDVIYTPAEGETGRFNLFITATDTEGICDPETNFFRINILPQIEVDLPDVVEICQGNTATINGSATGTYTNISWSTSNNGQIGDLTSLNTTYTPIASETGNHELTVRLEDASGICSPVEKVVIVDIKEEITVFAGSDKTSAQRQPVIITDAVAGGNFSSVKWTTNGQGSFSNSNILSTTYIPASDETGEVIVQLTASDDSGLCSEVFDTAVITFDPFLPVPEFEINEDTPPEGCSPVTVTFNNLSEFGVALGYRWDFGDGIGTSTEINPTYTYFTPGVFSVTLTATNENGEEVSITKEDIVTVHPQPTPGFEIEEDLVYFPDPVKIINLSQGATEYNWDFGDGSTTNEEEPEHIYEDPGVYDITLTAINEFGCEATFTLNGAVDVRPGGDVKVPTAFSPNPNGPTGGSVLNGNQNNDVFMPLFEGVSEFQMQIYNRWGEKLFESVNPNVGWDGYVRGRLSPQGIYIYKIELKFSDGRTKTVVGDVTLVL